MNRALIEADLIRDEKKVLIAYRDSAGYWTIGIGHLLGGSPRMSKISDRECMALFAFDLDDAEARARDLIAGYDALSEPRQRALVNMAFNLGNRLAQFKKFRVAIAEEQWQAAGEEMRNSGWHHQVGERAARLETMILEG